MIFIDEGKVRDILNEDICRDIMEETLMQVSQGTISQSLRTAIKLHGDNVFGIMPCVIGPKKVFGAKMISVFPENMKNNIPSHQGVIILFDGENGEIQAIVDAEAITAVRTSAVSAVATKYLSREDSNVLAILGAGLQGRQHAKALVRVRGFKRIHMWDTNKDFVKGVAKKMSEELGVEVIAFESVKAAVEEADVICTVTNIREPILDRKWIKEGVHINAVGACTPDAREVDSASMRDAKLFVDCRESTVNESGDYLIPLREGLIDDNHIIAEIGEVIAGGHKGRINKDEITIFESLGLASEDISAAYRVYQSVKK